MFLDDAAAAYWNFFLTRFSHAEIGIFITFAFHEIVYFACYAPWFLVECVPFLRQYKLQPSKPFTAEQEWNCFKRLMFSHFVIELPLMGVGHYVFTHVLGMRMDLPLPSWQSTALMVLGSLVLEDFYFYWIHRLLHHPALYKHIHKMHHDHSAPFGMAAEYAHPIETIFLGIGTFLGPLFFGTHVFQLHVWLLVRLFQTIEAHVGYDLPWSPRQFLPFYGGAEYHDFHHETFTGNYASSFIIWDYVFGTDVKYRQRREKLRAQGKGPLMTIWDYLLYDRLFKVPPESKEGAKKSKANGKAKAN